MTKTMIGFVLGAVMLIGSAAHAKKRNPSNGGLPPGQAKKRVVVVHAPAPRVVVTRRVAVVRPVARVAVVPQRRMVVATAPHVVVSAPRPPSVVVHAPSVTVTH